MRHRELLLGRLDQIATALERDQDALGLLALGSVGNERERIDEHSDLDFFVVVRAGCKHRFVEDLWWLQDTHPVAWSFRNTLDGHKALMEDGVFCEFAVFSPEEISGIPYSPGTFVWLRDDSLSHFAIPEKSLPPRSGRDWLVGEVLSNLLIGLGRYVRGEKLAGMRMVQVYALDRFLELEEQLANCPQAQRDPFNVDRRVEWRISGGSALLEVAAGGYSRTPEAADRLLCELELRVGVPAVVSDRIRALIARCKQEF